MSFRRVVVVLGASGGAAVTTAVDLARALAADLLGLFVEDVALFDLAALPFAREVGYPSAVRRVLDVAALERGLRAQAGRLRQDLTARLAGIPTRWTFEVVRGRVAAELAAAAGGQDLVVLPLRFGAQGRPGSGGRGTHAFSGLRAPMLLVDESHRHLRAIGVIAPSNVEPSAIVDVLRGLAPYYGSVLQFVLLGRFAERVAWQQTMRGLLAAAGLQGHLRAIAVPEAGAWRQILAGPARGLVVVIADETVAREALLDAAAMPLLVLPSLKAQ
jgi:hypothetical protein